MNVPAYANKHHMGDEEAARKLRYEIFAEVAKEKEGTKVALAHHMEDNAETMLFQLARGSGLDAAGTYGRGRGMLYPPFVGNQQGRD